MEGNSAATEKASVSAAQQVIRACDSCRKKKIRCEPNGDTCLQCIKYKTHCHFTPVSNKRRPRKPAGHKHVAELEERLRRMEALLQAAMEGGRIRKKPGVKDGGAYSVLDLKKNGRGAHAQPEELQIAEPAWERVAPTYEPPISSLSISTKFQSLFNTPQHTPTLIYEPSMTSEIPAPTWKGSLVRDVFSRRVFRELPSKSIALVLINEAFKGFNCSFPIFDQESFMGFVHERYSESCPTDPGWWACINVVLALAHRFRAMRTLETLHENSEACGYMQNALAVVSELTMLHNSLPAVQALLGMTIVLQGTPNPRLCSVLIATAMRLAQTMGLHRKNHDLSLTEAEIEQRKRVFWIAYLLDKDISLRTGQPPAQDDDDMDIELPSHTISSTPLDSIETNTINFFNCRIGLAVIQGQVYKRLYSAKAIRQCEIEQLASVQELDAMLANWRSSVPIDFHENTLTTLQPPIAPNFLHKIILRFTYVNCLITIHRPFPPLNGAQVGLARDTQAGLAPENICVTEARKAIGLIQITPHGDYACAWLLIHYFFAAVTTLLHSVLSNPSHPFARSDLHLVEPFLQLLDMLAGEGKSEEVQSMSEFCVDLNGRAREAVERVNRRMVCGTRTGKAGRGEEESVEEFIMRVECISAGCTESAEFVSSEGMGSVEGPWAAGGVGMDAAGFNEFDILDC